MSADVWLVDETGEQVEIDDLDLDDEMARLVPYRHSSEFGGGAINLTYNLSPMLWGAGMPYWQDMMGLPAGEAGLIWEAVVEELEREPDLYKTLNPENGWGTYEQAVEALTYMARACAAHPTLRIGGWL